MQWENTVYFGIESTEVYVYIGRELDKLWI